MSIERGKFILNQNYVSKKEDKIYKYKFFNDKSIRCPAFVKMNKK